MKTFLTTWSNSRVSSLSSVKVNSDIIANYAVFLEVTYTVALSIGDDFMKRIVKRFER